MVWRRVAVAVVAAGAVYGAPASGVVIAPVPVAAPQTALLPAMPGLAPPFRLPDRLPGSGGGYRRLAEHEQAVDALAAAHPGVARAFSLAYGSVEGRPIRAVELATDVGRADDGRPVLVVLGTLHAREWASGEVAQLFAHDLADGRVTDARIRSLLDRVRVIVVPVANPDGFVLSREAGRRLWRTNAEGVDLNRNAGALWGGPGTSEDVRSGIYPGSGPWSAPEAAAVHELLRTRPVTAVVDVHTVAGVVLHPPGVRGAPETPDEHVVAGLARQMGEAAGYRSGRVDDVLYEVSGTIEDWAFGAQGALATTIELGGRGFSGAYATNVTAPYLGRPEPAASRSRDRGGFGRPGDATGDEGIFGPRGRRSPGADPRGPGGSSGTDPRGPGGSSAASRTPRGGVREALLLAAEAAADPARHGTLTGAAPPGALLTATRTFTTPTSRGTRLADGVTTSLRVGDAGTFTWQLGPSTRPETARTGGTEAWTVTCTLGTGAAGTTHVVLARGARVAVAPCVTAA